MRFLALLLVATTAMVAHAETKDLEKVTFANHAYLSAAVGYIAQDLGFFEEEGLEVEFLRLNSASASLPSLSQGKIDVAVTGQISPRYINVIQRGGRIRLVAARSIYAANGCGYAAFVARSDLLDSGRLSDPASLRGLKIATERTSSGYYYWARMLERAGLGLDDVELHPIPMFAKLDAMAKGLIDVATTSEPWTTRLVQSGHARLWFPIGYVLPDHPGTFMVFGRRLIEERRDLGRRLMAAYMRAARLYIQESKSQRMVEIIARYTKLDPQELREMCWPPWSEDGRIDARALEEYQEWALEEDLIDAIVPFAELVDESFLPEPSSMRTAGGR